MGYALRPGVSFCLIGDQPIFLDVPQDRYFGLTAEAGPCFARLAIGAAREPGDDRLIAELVSGGVLLPGGRDALAPCPAVAVGASLLDDAVERPWALGPSLRAAGALARARLALRLGSLERVLAALAARKSALGAGQAAPTACLERVAAAFDMSALAVSPRDACLPRSLAMARWLLGGGHPATLVIGVKLRPFLAHCWVQCGDRLISDRPDCVREFTPILVV